MDGSSFLSLSISKFKFFGDRRVAEDVGFVIQGCATETKKASVRRKGPILQMKLVQTHLLLGREQVIVLFDVHLPNRMQNLRIFTH